MIMSQTIATNHQLATSEAIAQLFHEYWSPLPRDVVRLIVGLFSRADCCRMRIVCKRWNSILGSRLPIYCARRLSYTAENAVSSMAEVAEYFDSRTGHWYQVTSTHQLEVYREGQLLESVSLPYQESQLPPCDSRYSLRLAGNCISMLIATCTVGGLKHSALIQLSGSPSAIPQAKVTLAVRDRHLFVGDRIGIYKPGDPAIDILSLSDCKLLYQIKYPFNNRCLPFHIYRNRIVFCSEQKTWIYAFKNRGALRSRTECRVFRCSLDTAALHPRFCMRYVALHNTMQWEYMDLATGKSVFSKVKYSTDWPKLTLHTSTYPRRIHSSVTADGIHIVGQFASEQKLHVIRMDTGELVREWTISVQWHKAQAYGFQSIDDTLVVRCSWQTSIFRAKDRAADECYVCWRSASKRCACSAKKYCSIECQQKHWPIHRYSCTWKKPEK